MTNQITLSSSYSSTEKKNIGIFCLANGISLFGSSIYTFAIGLYVLEHTRSGLSYAITLFMNIVSTLLFTPLAGVIADRLPRKKLLILSDLVSGLFMLYLLWILKNASLPVGQIYLITFLLTGSITFYNIAAESAKPNLITPTHIMQINSIQKIVESASSMLGPALGGIAFAFLSIHTFVTINLFSFFISAFLQLFLSFSDTNKYKEKECESAPIEKRHLLDDLQEGVSYIKAHKELNRLIITLIILNFFLGFSTLVPLPYLLTQVLKVSSKTLGITQGAVPVGMILGALFIRYLSKKISNESILKSAVLLLALSMICAGLSVFLPATLHREWLLLCYFFLLMLLSGIALSLVDIPIFNTFALAVPNHIRGRVISLVICLVKVISPFSLLLSGLLLTRIPTFILPITGGISLSFLYLFLSKKATYND
ncbi:MAG: hypothetical protein PWP24_86 [Clostridiales bacterium]|nr:hypothetical protein [Clostridiales bacterium]